MRALTISRSVSGLFAVFPVLVPVDGAEVVS